jgi:hypothetical protein
MVRNTDCSGAICITEMSPSRPVSVTNPSRT